MWNGLKRPRGGPVKIKKTALKSSDVLVAKLAGAACCEVATVRHRGKYYFVAPKKLGGVKEVPADSLTDGLHASVWDLNQKLKGKKK
jgi:hypothetical protein